MFDFLPEEKRKILLEYPFMKEFLSSKNKQRFLDNLKAFEGELLARGFAENDLDLISAGVENKSDLEQAINYLKERGFPVKECPDTANLLAHHVRFIAFMDQSSSYGERELFEVGLPAVKDIINEKNCRKILEDMFAMARVTKRYPGELFQYGLPAVKDLINEKNWPGLVEIVISTGDQAPALLEHDFVALKDLIKEKPWIWPGLVEMAKSSKYNTRWLFSYGLPAIRGIINEKTWPDIIEMVKKSGPGFMVVFGKGIHTVKHLIDEKTWQGLIQDLAKIAEERVGHEDVLFYILPEAEQTLVTKENWPDLVKDMIALTKAARRDSYAFFGGMSIVKGHIKSYDDFVLVKRCFIELSKYFQGNERDCFESFRKLKPHFDRFGLGFFDSFVMPVAKHLKADARHVFGSSGYSLLNEDLVPYVAKSSVEVVKAAGIDAWKFCNYYLQLLSGLRDGKDWPDIEKDLIELIKATRPSSRELLENYLLKVYYMIKSHKDFILVKKYFLELSEQLEGDGKRYFEYFSKLQPFFSSLGLAFFDLFIMPITKSQKAGAPLVFSELLSLSYLPEENWADIVKGMVELTDAAGPNADAFFNLGWDTVQHQIRGYHEFALVKNSLVEISEHCKGAEKRYFESFHELKPYFDHFGLGLFDSFVLPVTKSQKVGAFLVFYSCVSVFSAGGIANNKDVDLLRFICTRYLTKANVILKDIMIKGIEQEIIPKPISKEAEIIKAFLEEAPAYLVYLYPPFKSLYLGHTSDARIEKIAALFKDVKVLKKDIMSGEISREYDYNTFFSVLYYVFACHDITVPKENYLHVYKERKDRQDDIPKRAQLSLNVKLSRGGHMLKDEKNPVKEDAWGILIKVAREVKSKQDFDAASFGFELLQAYTDNSLQEKREQFIKGIYQFSVNHGWSLPDFRMEFDVLAKYKEFVGDRIVNDLIYGILKESLEKDPQRFFAVQNQILGKKVDLTGLAKQLFGISRSNMPHGKKADVLGKVLRQNGFHTEDVTPLIIMDPAQLNVWLSSQQPNIVEKGLTAKIFHALYGEEYKSMQEEMTKFEFKKEGWGKGKEYVFTISKRKAHSVAMFNMGVCVAPDDRLWNSPDMWQLIIFDKEGDAHGGAILRTIEENGKKYLVLSIQPSSSILNEVSPFQVADSIIRFCIVIAKRLKYNNVLIPVSSAIHSNRGSIQQVIAEKYGKSVQLKTENEHEFSYSPHNYKYQEFYVAY
jgi:hypothetical protein